MQHAHSLFYKGLHIICACRRDINVLLGIKNPKLVSDHKDSSDKNFPFRCFTCMWNPLSEETSVFLALEWIILKMKYSLPCVRTPSPQQDAWVFLYTGTGEVWWLPSFMWSTGMACKWTLLLPPGRKLFKTSITSMSKSVFHFGKRLQKPNLHAAFVFIFKYPGTNERRFPRAAGLKASLHGTGWQPMKHLAGSNFTGLYLYTFLLIGFTC